MYSNPEIKSWAGLYLQRNSFEVPEGALEIANNIFIPNDDLIQKTRGFYQYYEQDLSSDLNNLFFFQDFLLSIANNELSYYEDTGTPPNQTGVQNIIPVDTNTSVSVIEPRVSRSFQSNGNLYFTTDNGILKLPQVQDSMITQAGAPPGLDISALFKIGSSSNFFASGTTMGYRTLFGYYDSNNNLILGSPGGVFTVTNTEVIPTVNNAARSGAGPYIITVTRVSHRLTTGMYLLFFDASGGFTDVAEGSYQITVLTADTFTYTITPDPGAASGKISYSFAMPLILEFTVPSEITTNLIWFYQIYRSSQQSGGVIFSDYKLLSQENLTSSQIYSRVVFFTDDTSDDLSGEFLYTNENSMEGQLQANVKPPLTTDVALYQNFAIYANCSVRNFINLDIIDTTDIVPPDYTTFMIQRFNASEDYARRYTAIYGVGNRTVYATCSNSGGLLITHTAHGFPNTGVTTVYISNITGGTLTEGTYYVLYVSADTFNIAASLSDFFVPTAVPYSGETSLYFEGVDSGPTAVAGISWERSSNEVIVTSPGHDLFSGEQVLITTSTGGVDAVSSEIYEITEVTSTTFTFLNTGADVTGNTLTYYIFGPIYYVSQDGSSAVRLRDTANSLVKATNRDDLSLLYATYTSIIGGPGKMFFQEKGFDGTIYIKSSGTSGNGFFPTLPSSFTSGDQVYSRTEQQQNSIFFSKYNEPEAVPIVNYLLVGSKNREIFRVHALKYSLIVLKKDGVWRITGDSPSNFAATLVDGTIICVSPSSSAVINNQVIFLSNQGVALVTDSSVQIISRKIEDVIQPVLTQDNLETSVSGVSYEIDRLYLLTCTVPNDEESKTVYAYNILNDSWTTTQFIFKQSIVGPGNVLYYIDFDNKIKKERKKQTKLDYSAQNYDVLIDYIDLSGEAALVTINLYTPKQGDIIVKNDIINIIVDVLIYNPNQYILFFFQKSNLESLDNVLLYESYESKIQISPYSGGLVGRSKQFSQMQVHFRDPSCTVLNIYFSGDSFDASKSVDWFTLLRELGWGNFPWGQDNWGQTITTELSRITEPAGICRIYVPQIQQRGTYLKPTLISQVAGDRLNIQSLSFSVRIYGDRVSR